MSEVEELKAAFRSADLDGNGLISKEELIEVFKDCFDGWAEADFKELVASVDVNKDGALDYSEFLEWICAVDEEADNGGGSGQEEGGPPPPPPPERGEEDVPTAAEETAEERPATAEDDHRREQDAAAIKLQSVQRGREARRSVAARRTERAQRQSPDEEENTPAGEEEPVAAVVAGEVAADDEVAVAQEGPAGEEVAPPDGHEEGEEDDSVPPSSSSQLREVLTQFGLDVPKTDTEEQLLVRWEVHRTEIKARGNLAIGCEVRADSTLADPAAMLTGKGCQERQWMAEVSDGPVWVEVFFPSPVSLGAVLVVWGTGALVSDLAVYAGFASDQPGVLTTVRERGTVIREDAPPTAVSDGTSISFVRPETVLNQVVSLRLEIFAEPAAKVSITDIVVRGGS